MRAASRLTALAVGLCGCAATPPVGYVAAHDVLPGRGEPLASEQAAYGYRSIELTPHVHRVTYRGDPMTSPERAEDFALLRAAELALEAGFPHFRVLERADATSTTTHTTALPSAPICDAYGDCYVPPPPTLTTTLTHPVFSFTVEFLRAESEPELFVFDARFVFHTLRQRHAVGSPIPADAWYADYSCRAGGSPE